MNKIFLKGNIGHAPRISLTQDGREIATFSLATSSSWKDETGEWQTHTDWHRIIVFRESTVGWVKDLLQKGDTIYVEGKLTYRQKKDKYNHSRLMPYIVISDSGGKLEHIRKPGNVSSAVSHPSHIQEDKSRLLNPSPKEPEEPSLLENDLPNSCPEMSSHRHFSQGDHSQKVPFRGVPAQQTSFKGVLFEREHGTPEENSLKATSLRETPPREDLLNVKFLKESSHQENSAFTQPIHLEKEKN